MEFIETHKIKISFVVFIVVLSLFLVAFFMKSLEGNAQSPESIVKLEEVDTKTKESFYVDIKGAVKKPGVYEVQSGAIVNDVLKLAGGLKKNGTTKNINLSQLVKEEMVIYIFTTSEIKKTTSTPLKTDTTCKCETIEVKNCITDATTTEKNYSNKTENENTSITKDEKVNINTASKEELMTVNGIGASKADAIIIYRQKNKFTNIEELKNVSGIGDALFAKIKDNITI